jgi:hypothetical protein
VAYAVLLVGPLWMVLIAGPRLRPTTASGPAPGHGGGGDAAAGVGTPAGAAHDRDQILVMVVPLHFYHRLRDFLVVQLNFPGDGDLRWMRHGQPGLMFTMGWVLLQRATAPLREVHRLNESLSDTVSQREAELQQPFDRLQPVQRSR